MNKVEIDAALKSRESRNRRIELSVIVLFVVFILTVGVAGGIIFGGQGAIGPVILGMMLIIASHATLLSPISNLLSRLCPRWIIDESDPHVLRLYGSVACDGRDKAAESLLTRRSGYRIIDNSFKLYGCTMAAVPAEPSCG